MDHTALAPSLVISHEITEDSPLHGLSGEDIRAADGAIFVSVAATDDNHLQVTHRPMCLVLNGAYVSCINAEDIRAADCTILTGNICWSCAQQCITCMP